MRNKKEGNVILVFECASDAHWMKDVVQFPNALAQNLFNKNAILITRPNHKQTEIAKHIQLVFQGELNENNTLSLETQNFSTVIIDPSWYLAACKKAASLGSVLMLYPFYGDPYKGAKLFKFKRWLNFSKAFVVIKSDGTLAEKSRCKAGLMHRIVDFFRYLFINAIVCENAELYDQLKINQPHLLSKLVYLPNCPLDIYHHQQLTPFATRPNHFLFVGRADDKEKGIDILLDAWINIFTKIPSWKLQIAGPCSETLKNEWEVKLNLKNASGSVQWLGAANPNELIHLYNNAKMVVCPSGKESGPIVLSESILSGCAFIGTGVGEIPVVLKGLPGVVKNGKVLEETLVHFAVDEQIPIKQANELFTRMKDRNWFAQAAKIAQRV